MSNLPILYATLGALAGLPLGYGAAALAAWLAPIVGVLFAVRSIDREVDALVAKIKAESIHPEVKW